MYSLGGRLLVQIEDRSWFEPRASMQLRVPMYFIRMAAGILVYINEPAKQKSNRKAVSFERMSLLRSVRVRMKPAFVCIEDA